MCGSFLLYIWELFVESVNRHVNLRRFCFPGSQAAGTRQCFWLNASFESSLLLKSSLFALLLGLPHPLFLSLEI